MSGKVESKPRSMRVPFQSLNPLQIFNQTLGLGRDDSSLEQPNPCLSTWICCPGTGKNTSYPKGDFSIRGNITFTLSETKLEKLRNFSRVSPTVMLELRVVRRAVLDSTPLTSLLPTFWNPRQRFCAASSLLAPCWCSSTMAWIRFGMGFCADFLSFSRTEPKS